MLASSTLMAPYLETRAVYPAKAVGRPMSPRGTGTALGMQLASMLSNRIDHRKIMAFGLALLGTALYAIVAFDLCGGQHKDGMPDLIPDRL